MTHQSPSSSGDWLDELIDVWGRMVESPASTRGQGGSPPNGSVTDWQLTLTKAGWDFYKSELKSAILNRHQAHLTNKLSEIGQAVIGEDDDVSLPINPESDEDLLITIGENANNRLRAEQRQRLATAIQEAKKEADE